MPSPVPDENIYESMEFLHDRCHKNREHQLSDSFRLHLARVAHCTVGPEWGANGKPQSDHLHHIDIGLSGLREVTHKGRLFVLRPGDVWLFPGNTPVRFRCLDRSEAVFFSFSCEWLPGIDPLLDWPDREPLKAGTCDIGEWHNWLEKQADMGVAELFSLRGVLMSWLAAAIPDLKQVLTRQLNRKSQFTAVLELVEERLGADLKIEDLARAYGMPTRAFSKQFSLSMGMKPSDYLGWRVNKEALHWVANTDHQLKEIAEKLKFSDEFYFSRFFKKHNGVSPLKYRLETRRVLTQSTASEVGPV